MDFSEFSAKSSKEDKEDRLGDRDFLETFDLERDLDFSSLLASLSSILIGVVGMEAFGRFLGGEGEIGSVFGWGGGSLAGLQACSRGTSSIPC